MRATVVVYIYDTTTTLATTPASGYVPLPSSTNTAVVISTSPKISSLSTACVVLQGRSLDAVPYGVTGPATISLTLSFNRSLRGLSGLPMLLPLLERLDVSHCAITALPALANVAPRLAVVNVSHNPLTTLSSLDGCTALRELWAHDCMFRDAPSIGSTLGGLNSLKIAMLHGCPLTTITIAKDSRWLIASAPQLETFSLTTRKIEKINDTDRKEALQWYSAFGIRFNQEARRAARNGNGGSAMGEREDELLLMTPPTPSSGGVTTTIVSPRRSLSVPSRVVKQLPRSRTVVVASGSQEPPIETTEKVSELISGEAAIAAANSARSRISLMLASLNETLPDLNDRATAVGLLSTGRGSGVSAVRSKGTGVVRRSTTTSTTSTSHTSPTRSRTLSADDSTLLALTPPPPPPLISYVQRSYVTSFGTDGETWSWDIVDDETRSIVHGDVEGALCLKWPSGAVAVRVESGGSVGQSLRLRTTANAREGSGKLSIVWGLKGSGFIMGLSGATLLSTSEDGSGFHTDASGKIILRRWGANGRVSYTADGYRDGEGAVPPGGSPAKKKIIRSTRPPLPADPPPTTSGNGGAIAQAMAATLEANNLAMNVMARAVALLASHTGAKPRMDTAIPTNPRIAAECDEGMIARAIALSIGLTPPAADLEYTPVALFSALGAGFQLGQHLGVSLVFQTDTSGPTLNIFYAVRGARVAICLTAESL